VSMSFGPDFAAAVAARSRAGNVAGLRTADGPQRRRPGAGAIVKAVGTVRPSPEAEIREPRRLKTSR
jgi:hypothetical protein